VLGDRRSTSRSLCDDRKCPKSCFVPSDFGPRRPKGDPAIPHWDSNTTELCSRPSTIVRCACTRAKSAIYDWLIIHETRARRQNALDCMVKTRRARCKFSCFELRAHHCRHVVGPIPWSQNDTTKPSCILIKQPQQNTAYQQETHDTSWFIVSKRSTK